MQGSSLGISENSHKSNTCSQPSEDKYLGKGKENIEFINNCKEYRMRMPKHHTVEIKREGVPGQGDCRRFLGECSV